LSLPQLSSSSDVKTIPTISVAATHLIWYLRGLIGSLR
jgi:hypothetical protein